VLLQVVVEAHFLMRAATDPDTGALQVSAVQLSLVLADVSMPAAGPLVVDTAFSVTWANATVPEAALQVRGFASLLVAAAELRQ
jgi:PleD family two-component response regulator